MKRSLVLAGGGMRVAWQAGVIKALDDRGVTFDHVDGTSGGIMNAAALLSGVTPDSLCERWTTLDVKKFVSLIPLWKYLRPSQRLAFGDADGVIEVVFPHLGIDVERVRASAEPVGTFNVCDFAEKTSVAIDNRSVHLEHLVAGMSLPIAMPPVEFGGTTWTDAVWIRDANLLEAVERGADEIWLVWCIGNTDRYGEGPLEQYVHMIEMSAAGALNAELAQIAELNRRRQTPIVVHVVKPRHPLPLDPDFLLGRIDAHTLVAMGHRDAHRYLAEMSADGVALDTNATKMVDTPLGVRVSRHASGDGLSIRLTAELHDVRSIAEARAEAAPVVGSITFDGGSTYYLYDGHAAIGADAIDVRARVDIDGTAHAVDLHATAGNGARPRTGMTVSINPVDGSSPARTFELRSGLGDVLRSLASIEPSGAHDLRDRARAVGALSRIAFRALRRR